GTAGRRKTDRWVITSAREARYGAGRQGPGPDVLLIAGLGDSADAWQFQPDGLAGHDRLTAVDNRAAKRTLPLGVAADRAFTWKGFAGVGAAGESALTRTGAAAGGAFWAPAGGSIAAAAGRHPYRNRQRRDQHVCAGDPGRCGRCRAGARAA